MATFNPFYTFQPANANAGFGNLAGYINSVQNDLFAEFTNGQNVGDTLAKLLKDIRAKIATYNAKPYLGGFEMVFPSPFPALSGVQTITIFIQNPQLVATFDNEYIEIEVDLNGSQITATTFTNAPLLSFTGDYDTPLFQAEKQANQALIVRNQQGASFMPLVYSLEGTIAYSGLARCSNVTFSETLNQPQRTPAQDLPYQPFYLFELEGLDTERKYISGIIEQVVNKSFTTGITRSELITFTTLFKRPETMAYSVETDGTYLVEFTWSMPSYAFKLVGDYVDSRWTWQRFYAETEADAGIFITDFAGPLPYEPNTGLMYNDIWYDFEFCSFEPCGPQGETYQPPIRPGDNYQFNIDRFAANLTGLSDCYVGILDSQGAFKGKIGTATRPLASFTGSTFWIGSVQEDFATFKNAFDTAATDALEFYLIGADGLPESVLFTYETVDIDLTDIDAFATWLNELPWPDYVQFTATVADGELTVSATYSGNDCFYGIGFSSFFEGSGETVYWVQVTANESTVGQQFHTSVFIPLLEDGCYQFCLYREDSYTENPDIYAVSNVLKVDADECFSNLIEFWGENNSITEGFEYLRNWKQKVRVDLNGAGQKPVIEESVYRNSDGTYQRPMSNSDLTLDLHTEYIDLTTQKAMFAATRHTNFLWNGQSIFVSGELDVATVQDFTTETSFRNLSQMKFQALYQGYQPENNACIGC